MTNKNAKKILQILQYLLSPDKEIVSLGIGLFAQCYLVTGLNKTKPFEIYERWPWLSSKATLNHKYYPKNKKITFYKHQFINLLNSNQVPMYRKVCLICSFVHDCVKQDRGRNANTNLRIILEYYKFDDVKEVFAPKRRSDHIIAKQYIYNDYRQRNLHDKYENKQYAFEAELATYNFIRRPGSSIGTPREHVNSYKHFLRARYKKKSFCKILNLHKFKYYLGLL